MSETVHYRGTLTVVERSVNETLEEQCKRILGYPELESYHDSFQEQLLHENYHAYVIHDDVLYFVEKQDIDPDEDICRVEKNSNGTFDFEVKYYNGGCSFDEAIQEAFENNK
ncbi:MAG: hypothetical protein Q8911_08515 [Bacillota bacterium]|nr:hypothetical protein [Bacillota bacterium]